MSSLITKHLIKNYMNQTDSNINNVAFNIKKERVKIARGYQFVRED